MTKKNVCHFLRFLLTMLNCCNANFLYNLKFRKEIKIKLLQYYLNVSKLLFSPLISFRKNSVRPLNTAHFSYI